MIGMDILKPVVALAAWTMVMWAWLYTTRIPALRRAVPDMNGMTGGTGKDLDAVLPPQIQWKSHNYNHLHEAPTVFYAVALTLALIGKGDGVAATMGWLYLGLRIAHSLVQATSNRVVVRWGLFMLSSLVLIALIGLAGQALWSAPA